MPLRNPVFLAVIAITHGTTSFCWISAWVDSCGNPYPRRSCDPKTYPKGQVFSASRKVGTGFRITLRAANATRAEKQPLLLVNSHKQAVAERQISGFAALSAITDGAGHLRPAGGLIFLVN